MLPPQEGGFGPQLKRSTCPGKGGMTIPTGKLIVRISVSVAVLAQMRVGLVALMLTGNVPSAVGVPEINPGVQPSELSWQTVRPWGKPVASKVVGLLSAVI
jgi:hypothetical protein